MEEIQTESWDFKKILIALGLFAIIVAGFKFLVLDKKFKKVAFQTVSVKGTNTTISPTTDLKKDVENKLNDLKKEVNNINVVEVATSTPAVKKVLNDIKSLENLPQSQAKDACFKICNGL